MLPSEAKETNQTFETSNHRHRTPSSFLWLLGQTGKISSIGLVHKPVDTSDQLNVVLFAVQDRDVVGGHPEVLLLYSGAESTLITHWNRWVREHCVGVSLLTSLVGRVLTYIYSHISIPLV